MGNHPTETIWISYWIILFMVLMRTIPERQRTGMLDM